MYVFLFCLTIYYFTYRNVFLSLLDPLNFNLFFSFLASTVVFFLFFINEINWYYFSSYCLTQVSFTVGFFCFKPINIKKILITPPKQIIFQHETWFLEMMFIISSFIHIISQLYIYTAVGIPLLMESYLDTYSGGGGIGLFSRLITGCTMISWFLLIHFFINKLGKNIKVYIWIYTILSLLFFILSGSKGTFLTIGLILFIYTLINGRFNKKIQEISKKIEKFSLKLFSFVCIMVLVIILFKRSDDVNPFVSLGIRLIHSGDAYFYGYPNGVVANLDPGNGFYAIFSDLLGTLRVVSWDKLPQSFGMLLYRYHYPAAEIMSGANARHNIFGLFYFGFAGAIFFSFILGFIVSFCRNYLFRHISNNTFFGLIYTFLYFSTVTFEADIGLALFMLDSYFIAFFIVFIITVFLLFLYRTKFNKLSTR